MQTLGLNETIDQLAMADSVRWLGEDGIILRRAIEFEEDGKKGRVKRTWKMQVEKESMKGDQSREDVLFRSKWIVGVYPIATKLR